MTADRLERVQARWATADESDAVALLEAMRRLIEEGPAGGGRALFERASVHDHLGLEQEAVPLCTAARAAGLEPDDDAQAVV